MSPKYTVDSLKKSIPNLEKLLAEESSPPIQVVLQKQIAYEKALLTRLQKRS